MSQYQAYPFVLNEEETHYKFTSIGKRGLVEKAVTLSPIGLDLFNLALMDFDPVSQEYVDDTITDNGDMPKIMATVMLVILDYLDQYPTRRIFLSGNSNSRTRLYQISINKVIMELQPSLIVKGFRDYGSFPFEPKGSFESFLIERKFLDS